MGCYFISALTPPHFGEVVRAGRMARGWRTYRSARTATGIGMAVWSDAEGGGHVSHRNLLRLLGAIDDGIGP